MRNRYVLTLLHWISTVLLGAVFSGLLSDLSGGSIGEGIFSVSGMLDIMIICVVFGGCFSLPVFLVSLWLIPKLLKRSNNYTKRFFAFSGISLVFVLVGYFLAMSMIHGSPESFTTYGIVLVGYLLGTVVSSIIWMRVYKPAKEEVLELDTLDHHLTRE
jgi:hypothetical protein